VLAVVADGKNPITAVLSDSSHSWFAAAPGRTDLTIDQIEHVTLEALTSEERPLWPEWRQLT